MLEIKTKDIGEITVLDLTGALLLGRGAASLSHQVQQLIARQRLKIVLNAKEVSVIDSSGVGDLVASYSLVKKIGGTLKIANPTKFVADVLRIARLPTIIEVYETEEAALNSFSP
jgi:anti-sigma B factor antagonist